MGYYWIDQYSLLHFAVGVLAYFWGVSFYITMMLHILFELFENTTDGMWFINNLIPFWPGGKNHADSLVNNISDIIFTGIGWIISHRLDKYYK
jgi:membrane glycosyltransferase